MLPFTMREVRALTSREASDCALGQQDSHPVPDGYYTVEFSAQYRLE